MTLIYSPVDGRTAGQRGTGCSGGTKARTTPYRLAWIAHSVRFGAAADIWRLLDFKAPLPPRHPLRPREDRQAFILQQDPCGRWYIDPWGSSSSGLIRPIHHPTPAPTPPSRDTADTCFIIELGHASHF